MEGELQSVQQDVADNRARIEQLYALVNAINPSSVTGMQTDINTNKTNIATNTTNITTNTTNISTNTTNIADHESRLDGHDADIADLYSLIAT
jgi:chromosome segregation ATPase